MIESIIKPKRPKGSGWISFKSAVETAYPIEGWQHRDGIMVLSAVEVAVEDDGSSNGPEYHLSISLIGRRRIDSKGAKWVRRQFDLDDATEDNHVPGGFVRNFWRPVNDNLSGIECKCIDTEPKMVEDKGDFVWRG